MTAPDPAALVAALASALRLPIRPEDAAAVAGNFARLLAQAEIVTRVDLSPHAEPAPVFRP